jgi:hypothetical protein
MRAKELGCLSGLKEPCWWIEGGLYVLGCSQVPDAGLNLKKIPPFGANI